MRRRHRRGPYHTVRTPLRLEVLKPLAAFAVVGLVVLWTGSWIIGRFGGDGTVQHAAARLAVSERGTVQVSLDGGQWKRADTALKLYPGDGVTTGASATATLDFFDGTKARLNEHTVVKLVESSQNETSAQLSLYLEAGSLWVATPTSQAFTGSIARSVSTGLLSASLPAQTEAIIKDRSLAVFDGDGIGSTVQIAGQREPVIVGEGQSFTLPDQLGEDADLYVYRTALDPQAITSPFLAGSRQLYASAIPTANPPTEAVPPPDQAAAPAATLTLDEPADQTVLYEGTVTVTGTIGAAVESVRVNGYAAEVSKPTGRFSIELALPDRDEISITTEALAFDGTVLAEDRRTVLRDREPPEPPTFLRPAETGETYQTQQQRLEIVGQAPSDAVGIIVNDYRLQFFSPGDETWKYLASTTLNNYQPGENVFSAVAINKGGLKSEPATMTIILGGDTEGVVARPDTADTDAPTDGATTFPSADDLPQNEPLNPGTLRITGPSADTTDFSTSDTELLIEGVAPSGTQSVWVNDYRLRLFDPNKGLWNYIASTQLGTMQRGRNVYVISARNEQHEIIDQVTYVITFSARGR